MVPERLIVKMRYGSQYPINTGYFAVRFNAVTGATRGSRNPYQRIQRSMYPKLETKEQQIWQRE